MSRTLKTASLLASLALVAGLAPVSAQSPSAGGLTGSLTVWHSYGSGAGTEPDAFNAVLANVLAANPGLKVNVAPQPFNNIFDNYKLEVASGGASPDLMIVPNDNLGQQTRDGLIAPIDPKYTFPDDVQLALDGSKVDGVLMQVPESLKAVAMYYNAAKVANPPTTTDELLAAVKGGLKLGLVEGIYHDFGFAGAFGGKLMDDTGKCVADKGGFADAFKYLSDLKAAGAKFYTDGNALKQDFQTGKLNMVETGPWNTADFEKALGTKLSVTPLPAGPTGKNADPFTGTDGWYINPNSKVIDLATAFALQMVATESEQIMTNDAGHIPAAPGVTIHDPIVKGGLTAAAQGLARPQNAQLGNFWGPLGDALNQVLDKASDPTTTVANACKLMNTANKM